MHIHSFSNIIFDMTFYSHRMCLSSYLGLGLDVWFFAHPIIPSFYLNFGLRYFLICVAHQVALSQTFSFQVDKCICDQLLNPRGTHFLCWSNGGEHMAFYDIVWDAFTSIARDVGFHVLCMSKFISFYCFPFSFLVDGLTSCYRLMTFPPWLMLLLLISPK